MGKVAEMKKKKKGRPSLLDLQKRSLRLQQQQQHSPIPNLYSNPNYKSPDIPNPYSNPNRRSTRRNPNLDGISPASEWIDGEEDDDDERKEKKLKLVVRLPSDHDQPRLSANSVSLNSVSNGSDSNADGENHEASRQKRKINAVRDRSGDFAAEKVEKVSKATDTLHGSPMESGPTTPLPDKKLLVFILDRLQKKDTYGVFSEPVDPNELPDYHEIIDHPMDFGTVKKKLDGGLYSTLEQFETDVFLICSNAMQYNSPDTIYFRQARSILELAQKDFENLRQDSDDSEPQPKVVRRGRPPSKNLKKSLGISSLECVGPEFSSDATLAMGGDNAMCSNSYNLRKGPISYRFRPADALVRASHRSRNSETYGWLSEWNNEFPVSILKGGSLKNGKKQVVFDESRRDTYKQSYPLVSSHEPCVLTTLDEDIKQLMAVGLNLEHGYARSLARFAANLGPVVWKIASNKIERVLPSGLKFGPGWVGENEASPQQASPLSEKQKFSNHSVPDGHPISPLHTSTFGSLNSVVVDRSLPNKEDMAEAVGGLNSQSDLALLKSGVGGIRPGPPPQIQQKHVIPPDMNGLRGAFGLELSSQMGIVRLATPTGKFGTEEASVPSQMLGMVSRSNTTSMPANQFNLEPRLSESSSRIHSGNSLAPDSGYRSHSTPVVGLFGKPAWQGLSLHHRQDFHQVPPDLNVRFQAPGSPSSSVRIGSPQQPDLALQL